MYLPVWKEGRWCNFACLACPSLRLAHPRRHARACWSISCILSITVFIIVLPRLYDSETTPPLVIFPSLQYSNNQNPPVVWL